MIKYETKQVEQKIVKSITCDVCKQEYTDTMDLQEFLIINFMGGYGSVFGDSNKVNGEICQKCVKELLGKYLRIEDPENTDILEDGWRN
jgi:hypothetical protein